MVGEPRAISKVTAEQCSAPSLFSLEIGHGTADGAEHTLLTHPVRAFVLKFVFEPRVTDRELVRDADGACSAMGHRSERTELQ